jgi:hypothetical protein
MMKFYKQLFIVFVALINSILSFAQNQVTIDQSAYNSNCGTVIDQSGNGLKATWKTGENQSGSILFNFDNSKPLISKVALSNGTDEPVTITQNVEPAFVVTVGERDLKKPNGWIIFFDRVNRKPHDSYTAEIFVKNVKISSQGNRCSLQIDSLYAGPFSGSLVFTLYEGSPLIHIEGVIQSDLDARAIVYDAGLVSSSPDWKNIAWLDIEGKFRRTGMTVPLAESIKVRHRTIIAESENGSLAVFPAPHQYFYPLDFSENYNFNWYGENYRYRLKEFGLGIRLPLDGDQRYVPWFNAPPGTQQRLSFFVLLSNEKGEKTLEQVKRYTRNDQYKKLPDQTTFSSHYHIEHTKDLVGRQPDPDNWNPDDVVIPEDLKEPGFVKVFKDMKVDIVHLAEFHLGETPRLVAKDRLPLLKLMHNECKRLSDRSLLLLPGEEPNVHLGGHWISFFPKPVYWVLNDKEEKPFVEENEGYGKVYHIGNQEETLDLFKEEGGLMWTAHPRIKGSTGFPDNYNQTEFYLSDQFLGGAWKNMPADLSRDRLGERVLNLEDDMANWGKKKYILGEVDVFRVNPDHEQYAHMNVNYLRLNEIPDFSDGWQPVLDALSRGSYFTTTGEVLINEFSVDGILSGDTYKVKKKADVKFNLEWTFPLNFVEVISGDGKDVYREKIDLLETKSFDAGEWIQKMDLRGRKWIRLEVWDIAKNGAFTPPVWLEE